MIHKIKLELGNGLYVRGGDNIFHTHFYDHIKDEYQPIAKIPITGEPLITTMFWLKQTMWNHFDNMKWKKEWE